MMKNKILAFITNGHKFLALRNNSEDIANGSDYWFVVTGSVEEESFEDAVKREVKEETSLDVKKILNLNTSSVYEWSGEKFHEYNYLAFVTNDKVRLNEEHTEFKWLDLEDFLNMIRWDDDKAVLKKILKSKM